MNQIIAERFLGGVTNIVAISIITKTSWLVLPFQNAENICFLMVDILAQEEEQGRHTNVMKTYDSAATNQFIFSTHLFWWHSRKGHHFFETSPSSG